ncbi:hypothetical protein SUGI_0411560 [Cryptomeria japonica]|uniref:cytochrome P450 86B1 n=1 Tax=Cryptomeria japonica TaxID=3369 RepID=UPI002408B5A7|nr:cytochrome P450 86B1 [Cryptomeria japonica]GLJ21972.1 hypothetical protein SUGI_0411560 [Cryptomeria japonica]
MESVLESTHTFSAHNLNESTEKEGGLILHLPSMILRLVKTIGDLNGFDVAVAIVGFMAFHVFIQRKLQQQIMVWPLVGMLPSLVLHLNDLYDWFSETVIQNGGTFQFKGPIFSNLQVVVTCDPANIEYMLKTRFSNFPKGPYFRTVVHDLLGDGIFNADDELWRRQRKTASIEFHSVTFRDHIVESLKQLVDDRLIKILDDAAARRVPVDLQDILLRLTFDNVCMIAFGVDPGCLAVGLPEIPFAKAFEQATEATVYRFVTPTALWRLMRFFNVGTEKMLKAALRGVDEFASGVIQSRRNELNSNSNSNGKDLLTIFMQLQDEQGNNYSEQFLRDICINFILAGRDTSSVALTWFFWLLHGHPHVEEKILMEIKTLVHGSRTGDVDITEVTFTADDLKQMQYLQAAVSEALRLYPSVPVDHKEVIHDDRLPDGTVLKSGGKVLYLIYAMGRMESIWGKDCREFRPERWMRDGRFMSESAYKYTAFNGGPRLCLGKDFAYFQMKWVAASIISRFRVSVVPGHPVAPKLALTMYMKHGLMVNLHPRAKEIVRAQG